MEEQTTRQQGQWCCGNGVWLSDGGVWEEDADFRSFIFIQQFSYTIQFLLHFYLFYTVHTLLYIVYTVYCIHSCIYSFY